MISQAEIDAMVAAVPKKEAAPAEAEKPDHAHPTPQEASPTPASPDEIEPLHAIVADLAQRLAKIEAAMGNLDQLQKTVVEANAIIRQQPQDFQAVVNQLQEFSAQVEDISAKLRSTLGYNIGDIFRCNSCDSKGLVAIRVKCTECGQENWWGWWHNDINIP